MLRCRSKLETALRLVGPLLLKQPLVELGIVASLRPGVVTRFRTGRVVSFACESQYSVDRNRKQIRTVAGSPIVTGMPGGYGKRCAGLQAVLAHKPPGLKCTLKPAEIVLSLCKRPGADIVASSQCARRILLHSRTVSDAKRAMSRRMRARTVRVEFLGKTAAGLRTRVSTPSKTGAHRTDVSPVDSDSGHIC